MPVDDINDLNPGMSLPSNPRNGLAIWFSNRSGRLIRRNDQIGLPSRALYSTVQNVGELEHQICWRGRSEGRECSECRRMRGVRIPSLVIDRVRVLWVVPAALSVRIVG